MGFAVRVIGIIGRSYTGSTLLGKLFAASPHLASPGEVNWLHSMKERGVCIPCSQKSKQCPVITKDFVSEDFAYEDLYESVARRFDKDTIIVSDLYREKYERFVKPGCMDGIVLYKSPLNFVASDLRRKPKNIPEVAATTKNFVQTYGDIIEWTKRFCRKTIFINYEEFSSDYKWFMKKIISELELDDYEIPDDLSTIEYHYIYGSQHTHLSKAVKQDVRWKNELSAELVEYAEAQTDARDVFNRLMSVSIHRDKEKPVQRLSETGAFDSDKYIESLNLKSVSVTAAGRTAKVKIPDDEAGFLVDEIFVSHVYSIPLKSDDPDVKFIVDIGANVGLFTVWSHLMWPEAEIYRFEPVPPVGKILEENTSAIKGKTVVSGLVNNPSGPAPIARNILVQHNTGLASVSVQTLQGQWNSCEVHLLDAGKTFDTLIGERTIDVLKIDTEGSEREILTSLGGRRLERVRYVAVEYHCIADVSDVPALLGPGFVQVYASPNGRVCVFENKSFDQP